jgi:hypothetical protein
MNRRFQNAGQPTEVSVGTQREASNIVRGSGGHAGAGGSHGAAERRHEVGGAGGPPRAAPARARRRMRRHRHRPPRSLLRVSPLGACLRASGTRLLHPSQCHCQESPAAAPHSETQPWQQESHGAGRGFVRHWPGLGCGGTRMAWAGCRPEGLDRARSPGPQVPAGGSAPSRTPAARTVPYRQVAGLGRPAQRPTRQLPARASSATARPCQLPVTCSYWDRPPARKFRPDSCISHDIR